MKKLFYLFVVSAAVLCTACDKNKDNLEDTSNNPYPYLRVSDLEIYYEKSISDAEDMLYKKGYQGGYVAKEEYKYYKGNDTIIFNEFFENNAIKTIEYFSSLKVISSEARAWLLHPSETYNGSICCLFASAIVESQEDWAGADNFTQYKNLVSNLNSSQVVTAMWVSETTKGVGFLLSYGLSETGDMVVGIGYGMSQMFGEEEEEKYPNEPTRETTMGISVREMIGHVESCRVAVHAETD